MVFITFSTASIAFSATLSTSLTYNAASLADDADFLTSDTNFLIDDAAFLTVACLALCG